MKYQVDLNSDIGEGFGTYRLGMDKDIIDHVSSINIACGWHAGDSLIMDATIGLAKEKKVSIGAHPGYPDLIGFGRRTLKITAQEARAYMIYQVGALAGFAQLHKLTLQHVKLHGAFYNDSANNEILANAILDALEEYDTNIIFLALSGTYIAKEAKRRNLRIAQEVFADRGYNRDGTLVNRSLPGAFITNVDEAIERVQKMVKQKKVTAVDGSEIDIEVDSICVHGDNPHAVEFSKRIKEGLLSEDIAVKNLDSFIH